MSPARDGPRSPAACLAEINRIKTDYGGGAAARKITLLRALGRRTLASARAVERLHEVLCFLRALPDDRDVLRLVERMLRGFAARADLRRHRRALADTGIAGTAIHYPFFWFTALWAARRWPGRLSIDWRAFDRKQRLADWLHLLLPYSETPAFDELHLPTREWIDRLKGPGETDADFVIRRFSALPGTSFARETLYESLDLPLRLAPGSTPSRTLARYPRGPVVFRTRPLRRDRPRLRGEILRPPLSVRALPPREGRALVDLAREAMVCRSRDLDIFEHGDPRDVRLVDCGEGLQFACIGAVPERRLLLEAVYGFLTLLDGVPIGYALASALFRSSEVAYNVFETFRGAESAAVFGRVLGMVRRLFGSDAFSIDPYQLGHDNDEGLRSGAWWFYYKLGFRPHDRDVRRLVRRELARRRHDPRHRSGRATLQALSAAPMFHYLGRPRPDVLGRVSLGDIGLGISRHLARRFGADREAGLRECARAAARLLGVAAPGARAAGERLAWQRWSPLVLALPGIGRWPAADRRALARIVRAKGGRRESDFVALFNRHGRLHRALVRLAAATDARSGS